MIYYPEMSLTEPVEKAVEIKEIPPKPWWTKEFTDRAVDTAQETICDHYCKWPSEYKDSDDLWSEKCDDCPVMGFLEEVRICLKQGSAGT